MKLVGEVLAYAIFASVVGLLSVWPPYALVDGTEAIISLSFSHAAERVGECRTLSQEELNKLPPNMRKPSDCPRERHPLRIELRSGKEVLYKAQLAPSGIWADGKSNVYRRIVVAAGVHEIFVGMNDSGGDKTFDFERSASVDVPAGRNIVIRFDDQSQQFTID
jgi:hypothetical protein